MNYLVDIPHELQEYGFCKVFAVRNEVIHIKHILTEIFIRKTIPIDSMLKRINKSLFEYMEFISHRLRKIHYFSRDMKYDLTKDLVIKYFFPLIEKNKDLKTIIVLDFDGVVTKKGFKELYHLCLQRGKTIICTANPTVSNSWFINNQYLIPNHIFACKGKEKKINILIELAKKYDKVFYVDNEKEYLNYAWIYGINTFLYSNKKINYYSLKTK